jgi:GTP-binding protein
MRIGVTQRNVLYWHQDAGYIVSSLTGDRKGILLEMNESMNAKTRLRLEVPSRGLLGFQSEAASATRGTAIVNHVYLEDRKYMGALGDGLEKGKLISSEPGKATQYALSSLSARGVLFVEPGDVVYPGMIIGENAKEGDLVSNSNGSSFGWMYGPIDDYATMNAALL